MKNIIRIILILTILALAYFLTIYVIDIFDNNKLSSNSTLTTIENYDYTLSSNDGSLYKDTFNELKEVLNSETIDEEAYASLIAKLFIIDFFTLNNKLNNKDVGGLEFVYTDIIDNFKLKAEDTVYKYIESNVYGDRDQELPVVSSVNVDSIETVSYSYEQVVDKEAYEIELSWTYEKDLGYETSKVLYLVHEGDKLSLAEIK